MKKTILLMLLLISILPVASCDKIQNGSSSGKSDSTQAKDFFLFAINKNKKVELKDYKGKPVIINFWASWCAPCREEMPFFEKIWNEYKDSGLVFLGIDTLDDRKNAKEFLKSTKITYLNLEDSSGEVSSKYGASGLPVTFFIDREGKIVRKNYGAFLGEKGEAKFIAYLKEILK